MNPNRKKMRHLSIIVTMMVLFVSVTVPPTFARNISGQVDLVSHYIWRGMDLNPDKKPVLQPGITYTFGDSGFSANVWFSISFEESDRLETDFTLSYDFQISENISLSAGIIHYGWYLTDNFNFDRDTSHEIYLSATLPKLPLNPSLTLYYDFHNGDGLYIEGAVGHSFKLTDKITADLSATLGYNDGQWLEDESGFSDLNIGIAIPIKLGNYTLTPYANYTAVLLEALGEDDYFWVGVSLAF